MVSKQRLLARILELENKLEGFNSVLERQEQQFAAIMRYLKTEFTYGIFSDMTTKQGILVRAKVQRKSK